MHLDLSIPEDTEKAKEYFNKLLSTKKKIEIKDLSAKRSIRINAYLHICITLFALEFGYTIEEAKTLLKRKCAFMIYEKNDIKFLKRTRDLDNSDCSKFVEFIRNFASQQGCYIPDAEEYKDKKFNIDKQISNNKQFL